MLQELVSSEGKVSLSHFQIKQNFFDFGFFDFTFDRNFVLCGCVRGIWNNIPFEWERTWKNFRYLYQKKIQFISKIVLIFRQPSQPVCCVNIVFFDVNKYFNNHIHSKYFPFVFNHLHIMLLVGWLFVCWLVFLWNCKIVMNVPKPIYGECGWTPTLYRFALISVPFAFLYSLVIFVWAVFMIELPLLEYNVFSPHQTRQHFILFHFAYVFIHPSFSCKISLICHAVTI